jgi:hypothetical protein
VRGIPIQAISLLKGLLEADLKMRLLCLKAYYYRYNYFIGTRIMDIA